MIVLERVLIKFQNVELGYPGGPIVQENGLKGDENRFDFPVPLKTKS